MQSCQKRKISVPWQKISIKMEALNKHLQSFPHFSDHLFEQLEPYLSEKHLEEGEYFLREGKVCKQIAFIEKGIVRLFYLNDGKETTKCFCKENTFTCSFQSLITQSKSDIAIQAIEPCKMIVLSYDSLQKLYEKDLFWQQVGRLVAETEYMISDNHQRFLRDLTATDRYLQILEKDEEMLQRVPLNHLATYLQITPETLSRIRKKITRT